MNHSPTVTVARDTKEYADLRHRAAYVYATGHLPTHLRDHMQALLAKVTRYARRSSALDGKSGGVTVSKTKARELALDDHPMVEKVKEYVANGYQIQARREPKARRPYGKVFLYHPRRKHQAYVTVQSDGSVLDHW